MQIKLITFLFPELSSIIRLEESQVVRDYGEQKTLQNFGVHQELFEEKEVVVQEEYIGEDNEEDKDLQNN
jgi:hypothetical protein